MASVLITSRKKGYRGKPRSMPVSRALREAFWGVMTPVVILGGIYGGVFTPTEAAAVAIFYGLFVGRVHLPHHQQALHPCGTCSWNP